ncbi:HdeD family acid-resistance protein [Chitinasiproducens palmae]|uniref:Uncharacterized membrane protein HdeD, DUF308 family n=1 Tax=Chitinasiproducens palmae TaxID=1770053 RepID=A0A1H2PM09_9BURK|nr:hypothetical protein [Chitinasiproducens palmae]SDV47602.1 Uncharacterized membrane protein HdeD, DUF308 family [Chitinasiproducens palmae]
MVQLILLLLGTDYLRRRWPVLLGLGALWMLAGLLLCIDATDGVLVFPLRVFAWLLLAEGVATLAVAWTGVGGQRTLRYGKGGLFTLAALLILSGHTAGHMALSMMFGLLFLCGGALQIASAHVVRFPGWRLAFAGGVVQIGLAIFFFQPYPTHYVGTVPYSLGLGLAIGGWNIIWLALRARFLPERASLAALSQHNLDDARHRALDAGVHTHEAGLAAHLAAGETSIHAANADAMVSADPALKRELIVHVWTPTGSAKAKALRRPVIDRYIAAVDVNGVISTGHAALESSEGVYISLYPAVEIDRSPEDFARLLRATADNDVPGTFQPDYLTESAAWCESTVKVRVRNYDPVRLQAFWDVYRRTPVYNLTYRNCSSTVAYALEAAVEGAVGSLGGTDRGWRAFLRVLATPELWVAVQIRRRAVTMAWTPGLVLDYARALSMIVDPKPFGWFKMARLALRQLHRARQQWREEEGAAAAPAEPVAPG